MTEYLLARLDDLGAVPEVDTVNALGQADFVYAVVNGDFVKISVANFAKVLRETVFTIADAVDVDINPANGGIQTWTLGAARTATAAEFVSGQSVTLMVTAGVNVLTWPAITWVGGSAPTLSTAETTVVELWKVGSVLYGALVGDVA